MTKLIGLTGGIASGKSTVSSLFRLSGYPIIDADQIVRQLEGAHTKGLERLTAAFGNGILNADQSLNRQALANTVFGDQEKLTKLNQIIQPLIRDEIWRQINHYQQMMVPYVILDAPLLFEEHYDQDCDLIIVVNVNQALQLKRLMARNGYSRDEAQKRINAQMPLMEKCRLADIVIDNNGDREALKRQVAGIITNMQENKL